MFNKLLAIDPGYSLHPTGWLLLEVRAPAIAVRDGRLVDPGTGGDPNPDGLPANEVAQPCFAVLDAQSRKGLDPKALVREALATERDLGGGVAVAPVPCDTWRSPSCRSTRVRFEFRLDRRSAGGTASRS